MEQATPRTQTKSVGFITSYGQVKNKEEEGVEMIG